MKCCPYCGKPLDAALPMHPECEAKRKAAIDQSRDELLTRLGLHWTAIYKYQMAWLEGCPGVETKAECGRCYARKTA